MEIRSKIYIHWLQRYNLPLLEELMPLLVIDCHCQVLFHLGSDKEWGLTDVYYAGNSGGNL